MQDFRLSAVFVYNLADYPCLIMILEKLSSPETSNASFLHWWKNWKISFIKNKRLFKNNENQLEYGLKVRIVMAKLSISKPSNVEYNASGNSYGLKACDELFLILNEALGKRSLRWS